MPRIKFFGYFGILDSLYNSKFVEICVKPLLVRSKRLQVGSCTLWGLDSSNPSWLDPREHKLGLVRRVGTLISVGTEKDLRRLKSSASRQLIVSNGFYQWIMIEFSIYIWCTLSTWFIYYYALKINKWCICYISTACKRLLGKVRKIGIKVHTLIHPPSQCGSCVQQKFWENRWLG